MTDNVTRTGENNQDIDLLVKKLDAPAVLMALYEAASPQGMGWLQARSGPLTRAEAEQLMERQGGHFDYVLGRPVKVAIVPLADGVFVKRVDLLDRDACPGAARDAIIRAGGEIA